MPALKGSQFSSGTKSSSSCEAISKRSGPNRAPGAQLVVQSYPNGIMTYFAFSYEDRALGSRNPWLMGSNGHMISLFLNKLLHTSYYFWEFMSPAKKLYLHLLNGKDVLNVLNGQICIKGLAGEYVKAQV